LEWGTGRASVADIDFYKRYSNFSWVFPSRVNIVMNSIHAMHKHGHTLKTLVRNQTLRNVVEACSTHRRDNEGKRPLERSGHRGRRIILKYILNKGCEGVSCVLLVQDSSALL
jgi:hypothetical protein